MTGMSHAFLQNVYSPPSILAKKSLLSFRWHLSIAAPAPNLPVRHIETDTQSSVLPEVTGMRIKGAGRAHEGFATGTIATLPKDVTTNPGEIRDDRTETSQHAE